MNIPDCITVEEIRMVTLNDELLGILSELIPCSQTCHSETRLKSHREMP